MLRLILRNLVHTLRKYPLPAAINLAGLVVALTAFIIIMSHVEYETTFDRSAHALLGQAAVLHRRRCR